MTASNKKANKFVESVKKGFADIKMVAEEGNYKLFLKQMVVIILVFLAYRHFNTSLNDQAGNFRGQIEALQAQKRNEAEYLANKQKLLKLEPRFADAADKNGWLLRQMVNVFQEQKLTPELGSQTENTSNSAYTVTSVPVKLETSYGNFGRLLAAIENRDSYLKVSEFSITKGQDRSMEKLGQNQITLQVNTIFPKEKIAKALFKDAGGAK